MPLLFVEDDRLLASELASRLEADGFVVTVVDRGDVAIQRLSLGDTEAVILDLGLRDMNGMAVIDFMRSRGFVAPILALAACDGVATAVESLNRGADDFIVKPFEHSELVARVRALVRRAAAPRWAPLSCNGLVYRNDDRVVALGTERVVLTPREHELLGVLLRRQGETVTRGELRAAAFKSQLLPPWTNVVNVNIANLRKKLGSQFVVIDLVRGIGYRLRAA